MVTRHDTFTSPCVQTDQSLLYPSGNQGICHSLIVDLMLTPLQSTIDTRVVYYQAGRQPLARAVQPTEPPGFINIASTSGAG